MRRVDEPGGRSHDELDELRQEFEQLLVKIETAEEETAHAVEQIKRLGAELASARNDQLRQRQAILELRQQLVLGEERRAHVQANASTMENAANLEKELLREELQLTNEELRVSHEELETVNRVLQEANEQLEARVVERTAQIEKVVLQLSQAVAERDELIEAQSVLAREVDHRVKNSLQMVISLLAMQVAGAESESEQHALQQACSRVQAVAHTHSLLYKTGGSENVPFRDYLTALCADLKSSLAAGPEAPELDCRADAAQIPAEEALPLALIVNELVTNAFKHAFPEQRKGRVAVSFMRRKPSGWRLVVSDNGIGLPTWPPPPSGRNLGSRILGVLVERLHGELAVSCDRGTRFTLDIRPQ